jgi:hypothetical protein
MPDINRENRIAFLRRVLARRGSSNAGSLEALISLESHDGSEDVACDSIEDWKEVAAARAKTTCTDLHRIVDEYLDGNPDSHELVRHIETHGGRALRLLSDGQNEALAAQPAAMGSLEAIVHSDGSRPSFLIREGTVDLASSPIGDWGSVLAADSNWIEEAVTCVGRINDPSAAQGFAGTGFLVQENLILTNRHVLQAIASKSAKEWNFRPGITIDFGHEYRGIDSLNPRTPRRVLFCGPARINEFLIDHSKLDLALIELESVSLESRPRWVMSVGTSSNWLDDKPRTYTIGFPGSPGPGAYPPTLLEQLFQKTFGCKRLAPGQAAQSALSPQRWTASHDCTTLGGNSGSVIVVCGQPTAAAALHYGGSPDKENWGHNLQVVLESRESPAGPTLRDVLTAQGVSFQN